MRSTVWRALGVLAILLAVWLIDDAFTFALYADSTGRTMGCYTTVEFWLGVAKPRDSVRSAELIFGMGLLAGSVIAFVGASIRSRRRRLTAQPRLNADH